MYQEKNCTKEYTISKKQYAPIQYSTSDKFKFILEEEINEHAYLNNEMMMKI